VDAGWKAVSRGLWLTDEDPPLLLAPLVDPDDKAAFLRALLVPWLSARDGGGAGPWSQGLAAHARSWGARHGGLFSVTGPEQRLQVPDVALELDAGFAATAAFAEAPPAPLDPDRAARERGLQRAADLEIASRPAEEQRLVEVIREGAASAAWPAALNLGPHRVRRLDRRLRRAVQRALVRAEPEPAGRGAVGPYRVDAALFGAAAAGALPPGSRQRLVADVLRRADVPPQPAGTRWAWAAAVAALAVSAAVAAAWIPVKGS